MLELINTNKMGTKSMQNMMLLLFSILFFSVCSFTQNTSFTTKVSHKKVGIDDAFNVTYTTNKNGSFTGPTFKNFDVLGGPSQSTNSSISIMNGKMTRSSTITYTYTISPKKTGTLTVPGARIKIGNAQFESKPVNITVVKESQVRQRQNTRRSIFDDFFGDSRQQRQPQTIDDKAFYAKIILSKSSAYEGEHLIATYNIYSRGLSLNLEDYNFPTHEGFWTENIELPKQLKPKNEIIDGSQYQVYTLKKEVLFPQKPGDLKIKPFDVTARINQSFFSSGIQKKITSNGATVKGKPLPEPRPANFSGQVGTYDFDITMSHDTVKVNEPIDIKVTIKGRGNIKQFNDFKIEFPEEFETYDPEIKERISVSGGGVNGSKTISYLVIPRKAGDYVFADIGFNYFDTQSKSYKTINGNTMGVTVLNADGTVSSNAPLSIGSVNEGDEIEDILDISKEGTLSKKGDYFFNSLGFYGLIGGIGLLFIGFIVVNKKIEDNSQDNEANRIKKARKALVKKMAVAKNYLDKGEKGLFYTETIRSLHQYIGDKLQIETSQLTKQNIKDRLGERNVSDTVANHLVDVLENCEMAKFASMAKGNETKIYEDSLIVIEKIEQEFKS